MPQRSRTGPRRPPKYAELFNDIVEKIKSGEFSAGDRIPSENELIAGFGVSNTTARRALLELKSNGWVRKVRGSGTFVAELAPDRRLVRQLGSFGAICGSFSENLAREGYRPSVKIVEKKTVRGGAVARIGSQAYEIKSDALKVRCLRYADSILLKDETKYLSLTLFPGAAEIDSDEISAILCPGARGPKIARVVRDISATLSTLADGGGRFGAKPAALVTLEGAAVCAGGEVAEIEFSLYRADRYRFFVEAENLPRGEERFGNE